MVKVHRLLLFTFDPRSSFILTDLFLETQCFFKLIEGALSSQDTSFFLFCVLACHSLGVCDDWDLREERGIHASAEAELCSDASTLVSELDLFLLGLFLSFNVPARGHLLSCNRARAHSVLLLRSDKAPQSLLSQS